MGQNSLESVGTKKPGRSGAAHEVVTDIYSTVADFSDELELGAQVLGIQRGSIEELVGNPPVN